MVTATVLLVVGVIGMVGGAWLLFRKRQRLSGSLLLVAGAVVFILGYSWPAELIGEGNVEAPEAPRLVPTAQETP